MTVDAEYCYDTFGIRNAFLKYHVLVFVTFVVIVTVNSIFTVFFFTGGVSFTDKAVQISSR